MKRFIFRCLQYTLTLALLGVRSKNERVYAGFPILLFVDLGVSGISPSPREVVKGGPAGSGPPFDSSSKHF